MELKESIESLKGNWMKFESFAWFHQPDDAPNWCIVYTSNRDSGIVAKSNAAYFHKRLNPLVDDTEDVLEFGANHWACGYVDGWAVRVVDAAGNPTPAFKVLHELLNERDARDILDEDDYNQRFEEGKRENIKFYVSHCLPRGCELKDGLPDDWIDQVLKRLDELDENWVDDLDEDGTPRPRDLERALEQLGWLEREAA